VRVTLAGALLCLILAFVIPVRYSVTTTVLPPEPSNASASLLAGLASRAPSSPGLGMLASGLLSSRSNGELFVDLLHSGSVESAIADRFHLQQVYGKRFHEDTLRRLAASTDVSENKKSGVISITVTDHDRGRAQAMSAAYVDELNTLLARVSTSSAHRERMFIEQRLSVVYADLQDAQQQLSKFSSTTSTIDIKEQTQATVEAGARLEAQLIVAESQIESLRQIYGDDNVRVRAAREQAAVLRSEVNRIGGPAGENTQPPSGELYPSLRSLPALGVQWANLYRRVRIQETVYDLLSSQYESARIQEAKEIPTVSIVDAAGWPEKKSFPPRTLILAGGTLFSFMACCLLILARENWRQRDAADPLRSLLQQMRSAPQSAARTPADQARAT
jgi:uncharacterized protein involved in exopolysaccharide biosynthesis